MFGQRSCGVLAFRSAVSGIATIAGVIALAVGAAPAVAAPGAPRVHVTAGWLVGVESAGIASFKGVPYAAPPVGPLRWVLPQPVASWSTDRAADDFGPACMQPDPARNVAPGSHAEQRSVALDYHF